MGCPSSLLLQNIRIQMTPCGLPCLILAGGKPAWRNGGAKSDPDPAILQSTSLSRGHLEAGTVAAEVGE
jgi:hypothetical protein